MTKYILKSNGQKEEYSSKKLTNYLTSLCTDLNKKYISIESIEQKIKEGISKDIDIDSFTKYISETIAYMNIQHPDHSRLAARVSVKRLHKKTEENLLDYAKKIYKFKDKAGRDCQLLNDQTFSVFQKYSENLQKIVKYDRDLDYDFFGLKTLEKSYLLKVQGEIAERPQQLIMRVAVGIHGDNIEKVKETYDLMSQRWFTHATPTLFNAGTPKQQMSSCFLLAMKDDSIHGIYDTLKRCSLISKSAGGIGISISNIRAKGSYIRGTNGISNGIVPMLRVYDSTARYVDQGGGKRKGSFAIYLEPWHADVREFLELKKNNGKEEMRARDLFYAIWMPDLFMKRVEQDGMWTLMCPAECPGLPEVYGEKFEQLYTKYEKEGKGRETIKARDLWYQIIQSQIETGTPYMLYKDACNEKSNQKNLGTIKSSNLCTEIIEYTSPGEVAVCNLASIALPKFIKNGKFDFEALVKVTKVVTKNLNIIIDKNYYPVEEAKVSNLKHRPIGIGVQGLADTFAMLKLDYDSPEALDLNNKIFESIYYGACYASMELAKKDGKYESFDGSPASQGMLQFDLWKKEAKMYDWKTLKKDIQKFGMRNSLLLAPMPTASSAQILGNNETFEAFTSNLYSRRVLSGEFICINKHLIKELVEIDLWNADIQNRVMASNGSIQQIKEIPEEIRRRYRTVWEISQKKIIDLAEGRSPFIDQSQSLNIFISSPTYQKISSMHFYGWKKGLKTGMYYLRSRPAVDAIKFTVDVKTLADVKNEQKMKKMKDGEQIQKREDQVCMLRPKGLGDDEDCLMCGS